MPRGGALGPGGGSVLGSALGWHRWLGLGLALPLLLIAITGALLLYKGPVERAFAPELRIGAGAVEVSAPQVLARLQAELPQHQPLVLLGPRDGGQPWVVILDELFGPWAYLHPRSGELLLLREPLDGPWGWLFMLHTGLFAGEAGEQVFGVIALLMAGGLLLGLWLWWPEKRLSLRRRPGWAPWRDLHLVGGFLALPLLLVLALTGAGLVFHGPLDALANRLGGAETPRPVVEGGAPLTPQRLTQAIAAARAGVPAEWTLRRVTVAREGRPIELRFRQPGEWHPNGQSRAWVHPASGELLAVRRSDEATWPHRILNNLYAWHIGALGDLPARVPYLIVTLLLVYLSGSGIWLWWRGRRLRARVRAARPATREINA